MSTKMVFEDRADHLLATVSGRFDLEVSKLRFIELLDQCAERGVDRALVDWRQMGGTFSTIDRFELGKYGAEKIRNYRSEGKTGLMRFAFLLSQKMIDPDDFGENVARNRGAAIKVTADLDEALDYLRSGESNSA